MHRATWKTQYRSNTPPLEKKSIMQCMDKANGQCKPGMYVQPEFYIFSEEIKLKTKTEMQLKQFFYLHKLTIHFKCYF